MDASTPSYRSMEVLPVVPGHYVQKEEELAFPRKLLYKDFSCERFADNVDLSGWLISPGVLEIIKMGSNIRSLLLDEAIGFKTSDLEVLRGAFQRIETFSLRSTVHMTIQVGKVCGSWQTLSVLDVSGCSIEHNFFKIICQTCKKLSKLSCSACKYLDDFELQSIGECILQHRRLTYIDLSYNSEFSDEGLLALTNSGQFVIKDLNLSGCRSLSSLAIAGLRKRMANLTHLRMSEMRLQQSPFEWIAEGCQLVTYMDLSRSPELDDIALSLIGSKCCAIEHLNISECPKITDAGIVHFFSEFLGKIRYLDLSGDILCGGPSLIAISKKSSELETLKMNGLSQVTGPDFLSLWENAPLLRTFEMAVNLKSVTLHRQSMIPHISDATILQSNCVNLVSLKLTGAVLVTDVGASLISRRCKNLTRIDLNYCTDITDKTLSCLGAHSFQLKRLNVTGCGKITDKGVEQLCNGCTQMRHLELSACVKLTDACSHYIIRLKELQALYLRGCDLMSDSSIILIANNCTKITTLDFSSLDNCTTAALTAVTNSCKYIVSLSCESCAISSVQFRDVVLHQFPLVEPVRLRCKVEARERPILEFNKFVASMDIYHKQALKIQEFAAYIRRTKWVRLYKRLQQQSSTKVQAVYRGIRGRQKAAKTRRENMDMNTKAIRLQKAMRRMFGVKYAKFKVRSKRSEDLACRLVQRVFRGFSARLKTHHRFARLHKFYQKLGMLFHKYWVLYYVKRVHHQILIVQAHCRGFPRSLDYKIFRNGIVKLQRIVKFIIWKKKDVFTKYNIMKLTEMKKNDAATRIKRFVQAVVFNRNVAPFTLICARYYDGMYNDRIWSAFRIQTQWRGYMARAFVRRIRHKNAMVLQGKIKLLVLYKSYLIRKRMRRTKFVLRALKHFCLRRSWLIVGLPVKVIQRMFRRWKAQKFRIIATQTIQRVVRGFLGRLKWKARLHTLRVIASERIKRYYRRHKARSARKMIRDREHMAAWKIQYHVRKRLINNYESKRRINAGKSARLRREAIKAKADLLTEKRIRIVGNIRLRQHNKYASQIQRRFRKYLTAKKRYELAKQKRKENASKVREEIKDIKSNRRWGILPKLSRTINETLRKLKKIVVTEDEIPQDDVPRLTNSILKFQTRSMVQEGIVDIHLTLGETERLNFEKQNNQYMHEEKPYFVIIPGDLSGHLELGIYLWVRNGRGVECICDLQVSEKPKTSIVALKAREKDNRLKGFRIAWHKNVHIEFKGECTVMNGKGGFAVRDLKIAHDEQEEHRLEREGFQLIGSLHQYNLPSSVWGHSQQPYAEDGLYKYGTLTAMDWFDKRMIKCVQAFNLAESDVLGMRMVYESMQGMKVSYFLPSEDMFTYIGFPYIKICEWVVAGANPASTEQISFSEYVHIVCSFCLFGNKELLRFVFGAIDVDQKSYLRREEFCTLVETLGEGSSTNIKLWQMQYKNYSDPRLGYMFFTHFENFGDNYSFIMWQVNKLHRLLQDFNLGRDFWDNKREQFKKTREDMGVILINV